MKLRALAAAGVLSIIPVTELRQCAPAQPVETNPAPGYQQMACDMYGRDAKTGGSWYCYIGDNGNTMPSESQVQLCISKVSEAYRWMAQPLSWVRIVARFCGSGATRGVGIPF